MKHRVVLFFIAMLLMACKANGGPSDAEIAYSVVTYVKESGGYNPLTGEHAGPCGVMHGRITDAKVEVTERGEYNEAGNYFPVKVRIAGICLAELPNCGDDKNSLCPAAPAEFTVPEMTFQLTGGDFGVWDTRKSE